MRRCAVNVVDLCVCGGVCVCTARFSSVRMWDFLGVDGTALVLKSQTLKPGGRSKSSITCSNLEQAEKSIKSNWFKSLCSSLLEALKLRSRMVVES